MENFPEKTEKSPLPVVAVDGLKIKAIREEKRLTQLYVASVVGVTTDTISRWENNRYPTIKRENAERLAAALEAGLADILRSGEEEGPEAPAPPAKAEKARVLGWLMAGAIIMLAVLAGYYLYHTGMGASAGRSLPRYGAPGEIVPVRIKVTRREEGSGGIIVRERLPAGWRLVQSTPPSTTGQDAAGEVKWLIPGGAGPVVISYAARIPPDAPLHAEANFEGRIVLDAGGAARSTKIGGDGRLTVGPYHWADRNGDGRIDDNEIMPAYYLTDELKGFNLDWPTIEAIWNGKGYRWDAGKGFVVLK